ncbi:hypothetical protein IGI04_017780 [Brassica rapa subsp. trilocularis]|uniref:Protein kinase domain-containing protein n=1 Tax=Brassica rapa subsp. trilocularis TaxID=1813537 RepID=A0ABQ7MDE8_BRACM|nr:hypothetical protein IGI04_017780 [Brassica rapa subsp. trilocularis]
MSVDSSHSSNVRHVSSEKLVNNILVEFDQMSAIQRINFKLEYFREIALDSNNKKNPKSNNKTPPPENNNDKPSTTTKRRTGSVPCGKRTEFGYAKDFHEQYSIGKLLGHGQFRYTYVAIHKSNGDRVAVKKLDKSKVLLFSAV